MIKRAIAILIIFFAILFLAIDISWSATKIELINTITRLPQRFLICGTPEKQKICDNRTGKVIYENTDNDKLMFIKTFKLSDNDNSRMSILEMTNRKSCPAKYKTFTVNANGNILISPEFGNCSNNPHMYQDEDKVIIEFPAFKNKPSEHFTF